MFVAAAIGSAGAWAVNYSRFGHRVARFGPFTMGNEVNAKNVMSVISKDVSVALGRVELPNGTKHNFGAMAPGEGGEHIFLIRNVGEGDLSLRIGASSCKCTLGSLKSDVLAPGEETEVKLEWSITPGSHSSVFNQSAQVLTNDPGNVAITMAIGGKVIRDMEVVPNEWSFGEVAAGEPFEMEGRVYSYLDEKIAPSKMTFSDDYLNDYAEFSAEPFEPSAEEDPFYATAKQGFLLRVKLRGGIRQGAVSQNYMFGFVRLDEEGNTIPPKEGDLDENDYAIVPVTGRIVGALSMIAHSRINGKAGGGYVYDFGRLGEDADLIGKSFVVLKGAERENTTLRIGKVDPEGVIKATLGEPKGRGSMTLYPLEIEITRGEKPIARLGKNKDDYGNVWIESDNPKVTKMRIAVKFAVDAE